MPARAPARWPAERRLVIIVCEQCRTRFHLDDARIPARGARVRCSRCKHAFHVQPPAAEPGDLAHALAGEAAEAGGAPAPEATRDLGEGLVASGSAAEASDSEAADPGFEEDWQFNEDPPDGPEAARPEAAGAERPSPDPPQARGEPGGLALGEPPAAEGPSEAPAAGPERAAGAEDPPTPARAPDREAPEAPPGAGDPLGSLGSPESWDLLGELREEGVGDGLEALSGERSAGEGEAGAEESGAAAKASSDAAQEPEPAADTASAARTGEGEEGAAPRGAAWAGRVQALARTAVHAVGWLALGGLVGLALAGMLRPPAEGAGALPELRAGGWRSDSARAVQLENARAGTLLLVTGGFERAADAEAARRPAVQLVDAEGRPIPGARAPLGRALPERRLRREAPERLRAELAGRAPAAVGGPSGGTLPLQALFASVPAEAAGFVLVPGETERGGAPRSPTQGSGS